MPFLKTISGGAGSCKQVDDYLSFGHRSVEDHEERMERYLAGDKSASRSMAFGHSPGLPDSPFGWHKVMDATRKRFGKDKPPEWFEKKRKSNPNLIWRNYYQWILSPDPRDHASAEEVGQLAQEWCERVWPADQGWQWIWSVHDDNASGVMHAHIILNAVNASTGLKVQISSEDSDMLDHQAQKIGEEHGMNFFPDLADWRAAVREGRQTPTIQSVRMSAAERSLRRRGRRSWVAEIRDAIDRSIENSSDWDEFVEKFEADGFKVEWSRRGIGYRHPDSGGHDKKVLASSLGSNYDEFGIRARLGIPVDVVNGEASSRISRRQGLNSQGPSTGYSPRDRGLENTLRSRIAAKSRRHGVGVISAGIKALSAISEAGYSSVSEVEEAFRSQMLKVEAMEHEVHEIESSISIAEDVIERSKRIGSAKARITELESLPSFTQSERKERNALLVQIDDDAAFCKMAFSKVATELSGAESYASEASSILNRLRNELGELSVSLDRARADAKSLSESLGAIEGFIGARAVRDLRGVPSVGEFLRRSKGRQLSVPTSIQTKDSMAIAAALESAASRRILNEGNNRIESIEKATKAQAPSVYVRPEATVVSERKNTV